MADKIGFAYSFWDGEYGVREGVIYPVHYDNELSFFRFGEDSCTIVTSEPGVMANDIVWFKKRNDFEGIRLLLQNESEKLKRTLEKINNYKTNIYLLQVELYKEGINEK